MRDQFLFGNDTNLVLTSFHTTFSFIGFQFVIHSNHSVETLTYHGIAHTICTSSLARVIALYKTFGLLHDLQYKATLSIFFHCALCAVSAYHKYIAEFTSGLIF